MFLKVRIPGWAKNEAIYSDLYRFNQQVNAEPRLKINGEEVDMNIEKGYAVISCNWSEGEEVNLKLPMQPGRVLAHEKVEAEYQPDMLNGVMVPSGQSTHGGGIQWQCQNPQAKRYGHTLLFVEPSWCQFHAGLGAQNWIM